MADVKRPKVFISYSWTSDAYQREVIALAERLVRDGVEVVLDVWYLHAGHDAYVFMERCVNDPSIDKVLILCDKAYVEKAEGNRGGVGVEAAVIKSEVFGNVNQDKFIPIVMERGEDGEPILPAYLRTRVYRDLSDPTHERDYDWLLHDIFSVPIWFPPNLGSIPDWVPLKVGEWKRYPMRERTFQAFDAARVGKMSVSDVALNGEDTAANDVHVVGGLPKGFADYSWAELKAIADEIAAAGEGEWLGIAKRYGLVGPDGRLSGEVKPVKVGGATRHVRILGFRHDDRADGGGKAGISFEFADVPASHRMNPGSSNKGGWKDSELHSWLNEEFLNMLPWDLVISIVRARKCTNNRGKVESGRADGISMASATEDRLWLLSLFEIYGDFSTYEYYGNNYRLYSPETYGAEGSQYQLYADRGVSPTDYEFCGKAVSHSWWWLRSPCAYRSGFFHRVRSDGARGIDSADGEWGVSPGFCF